MKNIIRIFGLLFTIGINAGSQLTAQEKIPLLDWGIHTVSIAASNTQYGAPFIRFAPIHPGGEIGIKFVQTKNKNHFLTANFGYFYHKLLAHAPYFKTNYHYTKTISRFFDFSVTGGVGYSHVVFPEKGYGYSSTTNTFESKTVHAPFFTANAGIAISISYFKKMQPFIQYDAMIIGNTSILTSHFRVGTYVNF